MLSYPDYGELDFGENPILENDFERTYSFISTVGNRRYEPGSYEVMVHMNQIVKTKSLT